MNDDEYSNDYFNERRWDEAIVGLDDAAVASLLMDDDGAEGVDDMDRLRTLIELCAWLQDAWASTVEQAGCGGGVNIPERFGHLMTGCLRSVQRGELTHWDIREAEREQR